MHYNLYTPYYIHTYGQVVTFHGGMVALAYEWGSANHMAPRDTSPDDRVNLDMATLMKSFGGQFKKEKPYPSDKKSCIQTNNLHVLTYIISYIHTKYVFEMNVGMHVLFLYIKNSHTCKRNMHTYIQTYILYKLHYHSAK